jgi:tetratricopeptide (TPR) repeat protein
VLPLDLALFRAVTAVQQGDRAGTMHALDASASRARMLGKTEIAWQIERSRWLARLNAGETAGIFDALATLQRSAQTQSILGTAPFWAFDRTVVARDLGIPISLDDELRAAMEFDDSEPPTIWAIKVRSLAAAGLTAEARAMFEAVPPTALAELPCSAHYLGTLGHLAAAALLLGARDYLAALYPLLARFPNEYTSPVSFYCEGSISHLLGSIAHALGRRDDAIAHLERAVRLDTQAELPRCAARARLELAQLVSSR